MLVLKILFLFGVSYLLLLAIVPKGNFLYEALRIPLWLFRLKTFPVGNFKKTKHAYGRHFRQYLLQFQPKNGKTSRQHVIVYIHGGGWQFGSPEMFAPHGQALAEEGYSVFMPSHRRLPFFNCEHMKQDLAAATLKILEIMQAQGLSDKKILLGGMSSGGNLAALLCFDRSILASVGHSQDLLAGVFLLGAPLDLYKMWQSPPLLLLAGRRSGSFFEKACPLCCLQKTENIPTLLLHGTHDGLVEYHSVVSFHEKLKNCHSGNVKFATLPGGIHMDAASWCFKNHPARKVVFGWLLERERENERA